MEKLTVEEFVTKSRKIHGNRFSYENVEFKNLTDKINVRCEIHGEITTTPRNHLLQQWGCRKCASTNYGKQLAMTTEVFIQKSRAVHGTKYDYSETVYVAGEKLQITCSSHGPFLVRPQDHIYSKSGCRKCSGNYNWTTQDFIDKANKRYNNIYDYTKVDYVNSNTQVTIICPTHGEFEQAPVAHLHGRGCKHCNKEKALSTRIAKGHAIDPSTKEPFRLYKDKVRKLSNENYRKYYHDINPNNLRRGNHWHLDHIVSIATGFINSIPAETIAAPSNLRIISAKENMSKNVFHANVTSEFDPNNVKTAALSAKAYDAMRQKRSNVYEIIDLLTGNVSRINFLVDWCKENNVSVSSARWTATYSNRPLHNRYQIKKIKTRHDKK